jgi:hypothetical protein
MEGVCVGSLVCEVVGLFVCEAEGEAEGEGDAVEELVTVQ